MGTGAQIERYAAELERREKKTPAPAWLTSLRREAMGRFTKLGFPTIHEEAWRYTNLTALSQTPFRLSAGDSMPDASELEGLRLPGAAAELVFVDGRYAKELSRVGALPKGVRVRRLSDAWESLQGKPPVFEAEALASLNVALAEDGALVEISADVEWDTPLHLLHYARANGEPTAAFPRTVIRLEAGSRATVVESFSGQGGAYWTNALTEAHLAGNASLDYYLVQREGPDATHHARLEVHQERDSRFRSHGLSLGGRLARHEIGVRLAAENSQCTLNGLFAALGGQHVDTYTTIEHLVPHTTSHELYKGILGDQAVGVFEGRLRVAKDAQKTDARQTNKNLLLSKEATINTKPTLEILANDVKCSHGAAIGQLEGDALFYLRSRGIDAEAARGILTYAFAADILAEVRVAPLRQQLEQWFLTKWRGMIGMGGI